MSKPKMIFKFNDGQDVEMTTLPDGFDFKFFEDVQRVKNQSGTLHLGNPGKEIPKNAAGLQSVEISFD
ncbi:hypothetical protein [Oceanobacillus sojae]|uniref:hypothetical protein n=1 Tax=Oceanobacillus sojae TaxID=582851 RepID=UPI0021A60D1E|nr:hypothetical protein [Oceanobacillus sojae]MCT1904124.1 hypothetical protein [Oceanobacillus sojae]